MSRLWVRVIRDHRIAESETRPCAPDEAAEVLTEICRGLDIARPIWLRKHETEWANFARTAFRPEHFVESVDFDRLEVEFLPDDDKKRRSADPRNQF